MSACYIDVIDTSFLLKKITNNRF